MLKSNIVVIDPANDYNLITVDDVVLELQLTNPTANDLALIQKHIAGISTALTNYCDRVFASEKVEETFFESRNASGLHRRYRYWNNSPFSLHAQSEAVLYTKRWPISGIDSIYVDDEFLTNDSNNVTLRVDNENGAIYRLDSGYTISWLFAKSIIVTYTGGYTTIPEDLQRIAIRWAEMAWFASGQDSAIRSEQVYDIASVSYDTSSSSTNRSIVSDVPDEIKVLLEPYMRHWNFA